MICILSIWSCVNWDREGWKLNILSWILPTWSFQQRLISHFCSYITANGSARFWVLSELVPDMAFNDWKKDSFLHMPLFAALSMIPWTWNHEIPKIDDASRIGMSFMRSIARLSNLFEKQEYFSDHGTAMRSLPCSSHRILGILAWR